MIERYTKSEYTTHDVGKFSFELLPEFEWVLIDPGHDGMDRVLHGADESGEPGQSHVDPDPHADPVHGAVLPGTVESWWRHHILFLIQQKMCLVRNQHREIKVD